MKNKFITCGVCGWCLELAWTGLSSFRRREMKLMGKSSIWMFPIYGMGAFIGPISKRISHKNWFYRGTCYMLCIFSMEYLTGILLKRGERCPWDYSDAKTNIRGVIRLDYAPAWFLTGLLFERLLKNS